MSDRAGRSRFQFGLIGVFIVTGTLLIAAGGSPGWAGAYDQLITITGGSGGSAPDVPPPTRVDPDYSSSDDAATGNSNSGWSIWDAFKPDPVAQQRRAEKRQRDREARRIARERAAEKRRRNSRSSTRRDAKKDDAARVALRGKDTTSEPSAPGRPVGLPPKRPIRPTATAPKPGPTWVHIRAVQSKIDLLRQKQTRTPAEDAELWNLERDRLVAWKGAMSNPNLPPGEREHLRLRLPTTDGPLVTKMTATALRDQIGAWRGQAESAWQRANSDLLARGFIDFQAEKLKQLIDAGGQEALGQMIGEPVVEAGAQVLAVGKVPLLIATKDAGAGLAETMEILIGRIGIPQAELAVAGGRLTGKVAFGALNQFMEESMRAVGGTFDVKSFWQELRDDMGTGQKAVLDFVKKDQ